MAPASDQRTAKAWALTRRQHGVITYAQLLEIGFGREAIRHRRRTGRLHHLMRGVYAVGRPDVGVHGWWMAAVLACGPDALLSGRSSAALWRIRGSRSGEETEVTIPVGAPRRYPGIRAHRRRHHDAPGRRRVHRIPVVHPAAVLVDLAATLPIGETEAAVNEADHRDLINPEQLLTVLDQMPRRAGTGRLRALLSRPTRTLTTTELERRFVPLARRAGLPPPQTQVWLGSHRVDFHWPTLNLVVETDSLRYHRTPGKQARDKRRDNAHVRAGRIALRFTHGQITYEPDYVCEALTATVGRLVDR